MVYCAGIRFQADLCGFRFELWVSLEDMSSSIADSTTAAVTDLVLGFGLRI